MFDPYGLLSTPREAANTFSQDGGYPRQRNVFLVRFILSNRAQGLNNGSARAATWLTFAAKSISRPRVNPTTQELNEYNKKRQIFTGYKLEPVRATFFDSVDGSAQNMWTQYSRYYFGDFNPGSYTSYSAYDATMPQFRDDARRGFGFTASNGGDYVDPGAQFFFNRIEIYQFYDRLCDRYDLINPRITMFEPDDLDYENSSIALISASFSYENLQYYPQLPVDSGNFWEFQSGPFFGNTLETPDIPFPVSYSSEFGPQTPYASVFNGAMFGVPTGASVFAGYRYGNTASTGPLGIFGNFAFGPNGVSGAVGLTLSSYVNPALASALGVGLGINPLSSSGSMLYDMRARSASGYAGTPFDVMQAQALSRSTGYGPVGNILTAGLLASSALGRGGANYSPGGVTYDPSVYGAINAQQTGTAQYGFNSQPTTIASALNPDGTSYGFGRSGITEDPLGVA